MFDDVIDALQTSILMHDLDYFIEALFTVGYSSTEYTTIYMKTYRGKTHFQQTAPDGLGYCGLSSMLILLKGI